MPITLDTASHWVGDVPTQVADRSAAVERRLLPTGDADEPRQEVPA